jgi:adenine-specific DNA-methyltransferase
MGLLMTKEQKFYKALQDVFIGAKIEGEGGFVNLMRIKSNYYRKIEDILKKDIEAALKSHPKFRDELFDKLYSFFSRYFTESGSIYFNSTPFHNNIYEKVYTDEKDVILFWKTQMLYYVKTDRIFRSLPVEFDGFKFYFDASKIESKKANEKRSLVFELNKVREDGAIIFSVQYSERGSKTKQDEMLKAVKRKGTAITKEQLERAFRIFEKQSEVDFFINKNAKAFLQEQFKLWSYQYFWEGAKEWSADRVNQLQILKDIAFKIINFISQFEDELVKIWNKPKFVKNSNYVITLDRIADRKIIEKIKKHKNYPQQIQEWNELGIDKENPNAPIDTKYFKDLELEIINQFNDLDKSLDGWLIKSENYQALNTILPKFKEKVQTIYIDPPFNLEKNADYPYIVNYKNSSWATLLQNRLSIAKEWINKHGNIFVRCDYNGNWIVRPIMNEAFENNFQNEIILNRFKKESGVLTTTTESLFLYSKSEYIKFHKIKKSRECIYCKQEIKPKWQWAHSAGESSVPKYFKVDGKPVLLYPPRGRHWTNSQETIYELEKQGRIRINKNTSYLDTQGNRINFIPEKLQASETDIDSNWTDIPGYEFGVFSAEKFSTQNSEELLERVILSGSDKGDFVFDFFLGSGTSTALAHALSRKWLGVEMGAHFYTKVLPRMKRVLANVKNEILDTITDYEGGGFFKYYELEQYEGTLANCKYEESDLFNSPSKTPYQEYVFMKDEKMLKALEIDYEKEKVKVDLTKLYPNIDIAETLSNLTGKWIKRINEIEVEFEDETKINTKDLNYKLIKPLIWW